MPKRQGEPSFRRLSQAGSSLAILWPTALFFQSAVIRGAFDSLPFAAQASRIACSCLIASTLSDWYSARKSLTTVPSVSESQALRTRVSRSAERFGVQSSIPLCITWPKRAAEPERCGGSLSTYFILKLTPQVT